MQHVDTVSSAVTMRGAKTEDFIADRAVNPQRDQTGVDNKDIALSDVQAVSSSAESSEKTMKHGAEQIGRKQEEQKKLTEEQLAEQKQKAKEISDKLNAQNIGLSFSVDEEVNNTVINVTNRNTDDLVRQIPSEDFLRFQKMIMDFEEKGKSDSVSDLKNSNGNNKEKLKGLILDELV